MSKKLGADGVERRCCVAVRSWSFSLWQGRYKIFDSFTVLLTEPQKLHTEVPAFAPTNHRNFYGQRGWFLRNSDPQCEIGSRFRRDVAEYSAAVGRKIEQESVSGAGIALDTRRIADGNPQAASWLHRHNHRR